MPRYFLISLIVFASLQGMAQNMGDLSEDVAMVEESKTFSIDVQRIHGKVVVLFSSLVEDDLEVQLLTKRGEVIWEDLLYDFKGNGSEKIQYDLPKGTYILRGYRGASTFTQRVSL